MDTSGMLIAHSAKRAAIRKAKKADKDASSELDGARAKTKSR
jgi:hypothetical protein